MDYRESVKRYRTAAASQFCKVDKAQSYLRNSAWHLLSKSGALLAVVYENGEVTHGPALQAAFRQLAAGMPAQPLQPVINGYSRK